LTTATLSARPQAIRKPRREENGCGGEGWVADICAEPIDAASLGGKRNAIVRAAGFATNDLS
jgi:hypothetical protein